MPSPFRASLVFLTAVLCSLTCPVWANEIDDLLEKAEQALEPKSPSAPPAVRKKQTEPKPVVTKKEKPSSATSAAQDSQESGRDNADAETQQRLAALLATDSAAARLERDAPTPTMVITPSLGVVQPQAYNLDKDDDRFAATDQRTQFGAFAQLTLYTFDASDRLRLDVDGVVGAWSGERDIIRTGVETQRLAFRHDVFVTGVQAGLRYHLAPYWQLGLQAGTAVQMIRQVGEVDSEHIFAMEPTLSAGLRAYRALSPGLILTLGVHRVSVANMIDCGLRIHL